MQHKIYTFKNIDYITGCNIYTIKNKFDVCIGHVTLVEYKYSKYDQQTENIETMTEINPSLILIIFQFICNLLYGIVAILGKNPPWSKSIAHCDMSRDMTKPTKWLCPQQRLRSTWASAQSDQSLRCALNG